MTYTPEQLREAQSEKIKPLGWCRQQDLLLYPKIWVCYESRPLPENGNEPVAIYTQDQVDHAHADALEEIERLKAERDRAFDKLAIDAVQYDALLAERDRERKEHAQWVRDHQADTDAAHRAKQRAEAALAEAERECARLRFHAEAMARDLDDWSIYAGCPSNVAKAYRDEFKEE